MIYRGFLNMVKHKFCTIVLSPIRMYGCKQSLETDHFGIKENLPLCVTSIWTCEIIPLLLVASLFIRRIVPLHHRTLTFPLMLPIVDLWGFPFYLRLKISPQLAISRLVFVPPWKRSAKKIWKTSLVSGMPIFEWVPAEFRPGWNGFREGGLPIK